MSNVWAVIHYFHRSGDDVTVAENRSDDPAEWERAHYGALRNMRACQAEAQRWGSIADELQGEFAKLHAKEYEAAVRRLEGEPPTEEPLP